MTRKSSKAERERRLSPEEKKEALTHARLHGLPETWDVEWDNKREKKIWISPDGSRKCYSLPQALKYALKTGQVPITTQSKAGSDQSQAPIHPKDSPYAAELHRKLSPQEVSEKVEEGRKSGLPEGWTVVWDNMSDQRVWISPDGVKKCKGIPQALRYSIKCGWITADKIPQKYHATKQTITTARVLTPQEVEEFLKEAKEKGLPDGWKVEWNNAKQKRRWIAPNCSKVHSIPEALRMSQKKGWLPAANGDQTPTKSKGTDPSADDIKAKNPKEKKESTQNKTIPRRTQHIPSGNRQLTEAEQRASMEEAKARGLEGDWKAEFCNEWNRRIWFNNNDNNKRYASIADALAGRPIDLTTHPIDRKNNNNNKQKKKKTKVSEGKAAEKLAPRKSSTKKRKANETIAATQDSAVESLASQKRNDSIVIPRKKRRNDETGQASTFLVHAKSNHDTSSNGKIVERHGNEDSSDAKKTSNTAAFAGKEMEMVVTRTVLL